MREQIFLRDGVTATEVITEAAALGYAPEVFHETDPRPFEIEFHAKQRRATTVNFVQNKQIGVNYLNIDGPAAAEVRRALEITLRHYDGNTSYERAFTAPSLDERVTALFHLALARGPVPEPQALRLLGDFLHHNEDLVRNAAVLSIAYFEWPEAIALLDDVIRRETNPRILRDANLLRSRFEALQSPLDGFPITGFERRLVHAGPLSETIWTRRWPDGRDVVSSIPQVVYNVSLDDTVEKELRDGVEEVTRVAEKSGHRTLRVDIVVDPKRVDELEALFRQHRIRFETQQPGRVAVDVPPDVDIQQLTQALDSRALSWEQTDPQPRQASS